MKIPTIFKALGDATPQEVAKWTSDDIVTDAATQVSWMMQNTADTDDVGITIGDWMLKSGRTLTHEQIVQVQDYIKKYQSTSAAYFM